MNLSFTWFCELQLYCSFSLNFIVFMRWEYYWIPSWVKWWIIHGIIILRTSWFWSVALPLIIPEWICRHFSLNNIIFRRIFCFITFFLSFWRFTSLIPWDWSKCTAKLIRSSYELPYLYFGLTLFCLNIRLFWN